MGVALGLALAVVAAAPAQAAKTVVVTGLDTLAWDVPLVDIQPGDSVRWTFVGTQNAHNVMSNSPNWSTESPLQPIPAPDWEIAFPVEGNFDFICRVHDGMKGTVRVTTIPPPPPPPPPLSEQPFGNDATAPITPETVMLDRTRPRLTAVTAARIAKGARVRFKVSEESVVTVRLKRGGRTIKTARSAGIGLRGLTFRVRSGRYRAEVRAIDLAGNRTAWRKLSVIVR